MAQPYYLALPEKPDGVFIGLATDSEFLLARTERVLYEGDAEEEDWLMAIEWADKNGADIVNSSLGLHLSKAFCRRHGWNNLYYF